MANKNYYRRVNGEILNANPPVDLTFKQAICIEDLKKHRVHGFRVGKLPTRTNRNRFLTSSLWLSNNALKSLDNLEQLVDSTLERPKDLKWLDLSYNQLTDISNNLLNYHNLTILYLHGNNISNMNVLLPLRKLTNLKSLTLHGNPIERMSEYRRYIAAILPQISNLDFSPILDCERRRALPTGFYKTINVNW